MWEEYCMNVGAFCKYFQTIWRESPGNGIICLNYWKNSNKNTF